jgi:hypothetical protein
LPDERWNQTVMGNFGVSMNFGSYGVSLATPTSVRTVVAIAWARQTFCRGDAVGEPDDYFDIVELTGNHLQLKEK